MGTGKEGKKVSENKNESHEKERKSNFKGFLAGNTSENRSKRRRTADGFALYSAEELGIGNQDADTKASSPLNAALSGGGKVLVSGFSPRLRVLAAAQGSRRVAPKARGKIT
ncbi:hypothetical protein KSP39_PZI002334 [Platanthera zijinensis]|uniref:Uncharacterized protein n=1 Tax=Platanthera zijinensis TaxID=2320716 RepID=A0AAP0C0C5_9ASPA